MTLPAYPVHEGVEGATYETPRQWWPGYVLTAVAVLAGAVGGMIVGGPLGQFMVAGMQVIPFAVLAFLAYLGVRHTWAQVLAFLWLALVLLGIAGFAVLLVLGVLMTRSGALARGGAAGPLLPPGGLGLLGATSFSSLLGLVVAGLLLVPAVRRAAARVLPRQFDPRSTVHAIALSLIGAAIIICFGQLIVAGGVPPLLEMVEATPETATNTSDAEEILLLVYGFAWTLPAALVAAGWATVRTFGGALRRLGLVRLTGRQVVSAIGLAVLLVVGANILDVGINRVWELMGWARTDTAAFERLMGAAFSPIGAVVIGVTAGLGEEASVRGVLQPRLGILMSNLFFTGLHAFQYSFDGLLSVFLVGLSLGIIRARTNTTTSSIVHGVYNFILVMLATLPLFQ